mmetsp:Transcript_76778/g.217175  ORF Transcript_76778/g.217175 Transcript_76778/m.217175 type:complete len:452 (-) Transcript_76778:299-1654(-)
MPILVRGVVALEVAPDGLEGVERHVRGPARSGLLAAGRLAEHPVFVHACDAELLQALVHEFVLAPLFLQEVDALWQTCSVNRDGPAGEDLDGPVQAPLAVVEVHAGARRHVASEVVALALAVLGGLPGGEAERLRAAVPLLLEPLDVGGASVLLEAVFLAHVAPDRVGLRRRRLDAALGAVVRQDLPQPLGEEDRVGIDLHDPVEVPVPLHVRDVQPHLVEHPGVERRAPPAAVLDREGAPHDRDVHGRRRVPFVEDPCGVAEDHVLVAPVDAYLLPALLGEEGGLVAERHHEREAVELYVQRCRRGRPARGGCGRGCRVGGGRCARRRRGGRCVARGGVPGFVGGHRGVGGGALVTAAAGLAAAGLPVGLPVGQVEDLHQPLHGTDEDLLALQAHEILRLVPRHFLSVLHLEGPPASDRPQGVRRVPGDPAGAAHHVTPAGPDSGSGLVC